MLVSRLTQISALLLFAKHITARGRVIHFGQCSIKSFLHYLITKKVERREKHKILQKHYENDVPEVIYQIRITSQEEGQLKAARNDNRETNNKRGLIISGSSHVLIESKSGVV